MQKEVIMVRFLRKLINLNMWSGKHTEKKNLLKALPKHLRGEKVTDDALSELYKLEFLLSKPSTGEIHISLNSRMKKEIFEFLEKYTSDFS